MSLEKSIQSENLVELICEILSIDIGVLTPEAKREDISEWDSLNHLRIISELKIRYGVSIPLAEANDIHSVKCFLKYYKG